MSTAKSNVLKILLAVILVAQASCVRLGILTAAKDNFALHSLHASAKGQVSAGSGDVSSSVSTSAASLQMMAETAQHRAQVGHLHLIFPNTSRSLEDAERALAGAIDAILLRQTNGGGGGGGGGGDVDARGARLPHVEVLQEELDRTRTAVAMQSQALEIELARTRTACASKASEFKVIERDIHRRLQALSEEGGGGVVGAAHPSAAAGAENVVDMDNIIEHKIHDGDGDGGQLRALREMAAKYDKASQSFHRHAAVDFGSAVEALHRHIGQLIPTGGAGGGGGGKGGGGGSGGSAWADAEGELSDDPLEELMARHIVQLSSSSSSSSSSLHDPASGSSVSSEPFAPPSSEVAPPYSKDRARGARATIEVDPDRVIAEQLREALRSESEEEAAFGMKCSLSMLRANQSLADLERRRQLIDGAVAAVRGHIDDLDEQDVTTKQFLQNASPGARQAVALAHFALVLRSAGRQHSAINDNEMLLPYRQVLADWGGGADSVFRFRERTGSRSVPSAVVVAVGHAHSNGLPLSASLSSSSSFPASAAPTSPEVLRVNGVPLLPFPQPVYRPPENLDAASTDRYLVSADAPPSSGGGAAAKNAAPRPTRKPGVSVEDRKLKSTGGGGEHFTASDLRFIPVPRACDIAGQPCYIEARGRSSSSSSSSNNNNEVNGTNVNGAGPPATGFTALGFGLGARRESSRAGATSGVGGIDARANCSWHGALELRVGDAASSPPPPMPPPVPITANAGGPFASPVNPLAKLSGSRTSGGHGPVVFETVEDALLVTGSRARQRREPTAEVPQACACDPGYTGERCDFCSVGYHKLLLHDTAGAPPQAQASRGGPAAAAVAADAAAADEDDLYARAPCAQCLAHTDFNSQMFYALPVPLDPSASGASELRDHLAEVSSNKRVAAASPPVAVAPDPSIPPPRPGAGGAQSLVAHALAQPVTISDTPGVAQQRLLTHVDLYLSPLVPRNQVVTPPPLKSGRRRRKAKQAAIDAAASATARPVLEIFRSFRANPGSAETVACTACHVGANGTETADSRGGADQSPQLDTLVGVATLATGQTVHRAGWYRFHAKPFNRPRRGESDDDLQLNQDHPSHHPSHHHHHHHYVVVAPGDTLVLVVRDGTSAVNWHAALKTPASGQAWQRRGIAAAGSEWEPLRFRYPFGSSPGSAVPPMPPLPAQPSTSFLQVSRAEGSEAEDPAAPPSPPPPPPPPAKKPDTQPASVAQWAPPPEDPEAKAAAREAQLVADADAKAEAAAKVKEAAETTAAPPPELSDDAAAPADVAAAAAAGRTADLAKAEAAAKAAKAASEAEEAKRLAAETANATTTVPPETTDTTEMETTEVPAAAAAAAASTDSEAADAAETTAPPVGAETVGRDESAGGGARTTTAATSSPRSEEGTTTPNMGDDSGEDGESLEAGEDQRISSAAAAQREMEKTRSASVAAALSAVAPNVGGFSKPRAKAGMPGHARHAPGSQDPLSAAKERENTDAMVADVVGMMSAGDLNDAADYRPPADVEGAVPGANGTSAGNGAEEGGDSGNAPHLPQHISDVAAAVQAEILAALNSSAMPSSTSDSELAFPPHVYYLNARATLSYRIVLCDVSKTSTVGGDLAPLQ